MKSYKFSLTAAVLAVSVSATAQISQLDVTGIIDGHEYVDLGLSVKWATCNIGAENAQIARDSDGDSFAWGEVEPKNNYDYSTCKTIWQFVLWQGYSRPVDVAAFKWGGSWRTPYAHEYLELINDCTWEEEVWILPDSSKNWGFKITGPNGNSIFLPKVECKGSEKDPPIRGCYYWSLSDANETFSNAIDAWYELDPIGVNAGAIDIGEQKVCICPRFYGLPVRAVSTAISADQLTPATDTIDGHGYVDIGLSVKWATCNIGAKKAEDYGDYFAWGETEPKLRYYYENSETIKTTRNYRDAARENWGEAWRLPTLKEFEEFKECDWLECSIDGKKGFKITGPNGNSIFLPAAGIAAGAYIDKPGSQFFYWSSTTLDDEGYGPFDITDFDADGKPKLPKDAIFYDVDHEFKQENSYCISDDEDFLGRYYGISIRPVVRNDALSKQKKRKK